MQPRLRWEQLITEEDEEELEGSTIDRILASW